MYFAVLAGSSMVGLGSDEISPIAEKRLAPHFGQPFVIAKIVKPKISDYDSARSLVIVPPKGPIQIEVRHSSRPTGIMGTTGFNDPKAAKSVTHFESILDLHVLPKRVRNFDRPCLTRKLLGFFSDPAVELWQHPKEPIDIPYNYFGEGFTLIFAERQHAPLHRPDLLHG
jgi:hypothetical protein